MRSSSGLWAAALLTSVAAGRPRSSTILPRSSVPRNQFVPVQVPFQPSGASTASNSVDHAAAPKIAHLEVEVEDFPGMPFYFTNIAIGNPPQPFRVLLDFAYGGLAVRSTECDHCGESLFSYNHSASSTSQDLKQRFKIPLSGQRTAGNIFDDKLLLAAANVPNITFGEVDTFYGTNYIFYGLSMISDGAIGFAPPNENARSYPLYEQDRDISHPYPNILHSLVASQVFEYNTMRLRLPRGPDEKGSIIFGEPTPDAPILVPLSNKASTTELEGTWNVRMDAIAIQGHVPLQLPLPNLHAAITLESNIAVTLPGEAVDIIYEYLDAKPTGNVPGGEIDCDRVEKMPDLILSLGGQKVTLESKYYVSVWEGPPGNLCYVGIVRDNDNNETATLGLALAKKFDLMFDMDDNVLGLFPFV